MARAQPASHPLGVRPPPEDWVKSRIVCGWSGGGMGDEGSLAASSSGSVWG